MPMKKKAVLSEEALQALFTEDNDDEQELTAEEIAAQEAKDAEEAEAAAAAENTDTDSDDNSDGDESDDQKLAELVQAEFDDYKTATDQEIADLKAEVETHEAAVEALTTEHDAQLTGMKEIIVGHVIKMRTALSLAAVDLSDLPVAQILVEYNSVKGPFMKNLPVGSLIPDNNEAETPAGSNLDVSNEKSLGF